MIETLSGLWDKYGMMLLEGTGATLYMTAASALFDIPARERIGRAKSVPEAEYPMVYEAIRKDMADQIDAAAAKGGEF